MKDLLYEALMLGRNKKVAREEYLVSAGKKEPASFETLEKEINLTDVYKDTRTSIHIRLKNPGYLEIAPECSDDFIKFDSRLISSDEAADGIIEIPLLILSEKLHNGKNFGRFSFKTPYTEIQVPITINNRIKVQVPGENPKKIYSDLTKGYLDFRFGLISQERWQQDALMRLESVNGNTPADLFLMLYKAHVSCIAEEYENADNILDYAKEQLDSRKDCPPELSAYYLYVKSLLEMDWEVTAEALKQIKAIYKEKESWYLLWILFYTDEDYVDKPQKKLYEIQRLFNKGKCISPVMYFEAYDCFRNNASLIGVCSDFNLQVLNFARKRKVTDIAPDLALAEVINDMEWAELSGVNARLALAVLEEAFDRYPVTLLSNAIAKLLAFTDNREKKNHLYFERAVFDFADIPGLFNYYMFTLDTEEKVLLNEQMLIYFSKDSSSLFEKRSYFYANVIKNRYENRAYRNAYEQCQAQIVSYAFKEGLKGNNDEFLSVVYGEAIQNCEKNADLKAVVFKSLFTERIICQNPDMFRVLVFHKELGTYQEVTLEAKGKGQKSAYISIWSRDVLILFKDATGNIYKNIEYELREFENREESIKYCINDIPLCWQMFVGENLDSVKENRKSAEVLDFLLSELGKGNLSREYEQELLTDIFAFYKNKGETEEIYKRLPDFLKKDIGNKGRAFLIELLIEKKRYNEAAAQIKEHGYEKVDPESLSALTHVLVQLKGDEDRDFVLGLSEACVKAGTEDVEILRYMCRNYDGSLEVLLKLYNKSSAVNVYNLSVAERILAKSAEEEKEPEILPAVFNRVYKESSSRQLINSFLEHKARLYFYGAKQKDLGFFAYLGKDLARGIKFSDLAKTSYLIYMSRRPENDSRTLKTLKNTLDELVYKGIMMEEFKRFSRKFALPPVLSNSHIAHVKEDLKEPPVIKYEIFSSGASHKGTSVMDEIFPGYFVRYFSLFAGDVLTYSVREGERFTVRASDMEVKRDPSRFSLVNEMNKPGVINNKKKLKESLLNYYMKDELAKRLF